MQLISGKQIGALKIALYAPEGIGKTTYAAQMPNPVFIDTEGGSGFLDVVRTPRPTSWSMLLDQVRYFIASTPWTGPSACVSSSSARPGKSKESKICHTAKVTSMLRKSSDAS